MDAFLKVALRLRSRACGNFQYPPFVRRYFAARRRPKGRRLFFERLQNAPFCSLSKSLLFSFLENSRAANSPGTCKAALSTHKHHAQYVQNRRQRAKNSLHADHYQDPNLCKTSPTLFLGESTLLKSILPKAFFLKKVTDRLLEFLDFLNLFFARAEILQNPKSPTLRFRALKKTDFYENQGFPLLEAYSAPPTKHCDLPPNNPPAVAG